jgi:predicted esterase
MVAASLREAGVEVRHEEFEDGHQGTGYRFDASLRWLAPRLGG